MKPKTRHDCQNKLAKAARCALADLIGLYHEGGLTDPAKKTIIELYDALKNAGEDMQDFDADYGGVFDDLGEE